MDFSRDLKADFVIHLMATCRLGFISRMSSSAPSVFE